MAGRLPPGFVPHPVWDPAGPTLAEVLAGAGSGIGAALAAPALRSGLLAALGRGPSRRAERTSGGRARPGPAAERPALREAMALDSATADPGWFGPGSVAWRVQADASMYVAGVGAFALQLLHPLALAGVADHSRFAEDFFGRIVATAEFVQGVTFGGRAEAAARVEGVRRLHQRVVGTAPDGRRYDAADPDLLAWVHLGEYLAIAAAYRRFGARPLGPGDLDRYVSESAVVATAMGVADPPRSWAALDAAAQAYRPTLAVGEQTVSALRFLSDPPGLPARARAAWRLLWAGGMACVPPWAAGLLGAAPPARAELVACRALVRALDSALGDPPALVAARSRSDPARSGSDLTRSGSDLTRSRSGAEPRWPAPLLG